MTLFSVSSDKTLRLTSELAVDDDWSDDEAPVPGPSTTKPEQPSPSVNEELERLRAEVATLRGIVARTLDEPELKGKGKARDDDTHYFESYTHNDIHEIMLKDTTRTVSYARFILSNPAAFKDKIVMDVGAGTGILSMLAAHAGAKHVYAIEASNLASKTRENIAANNLSSVITVLQSKVEDVTLPVDKVDVIISEWMGYMLLYESMLDSVLHARDRYLAPNGLMAPSQTRLVISAITGQRIWRDRVAFWSDVYGFDMPAMTPGYYTEAMIEIVDREEVVTSECIVRDINSHDATPQSLDFHSNFSITSTANEKTTVRAFLTWFDTFFSPIPGKDGHVSPSQDVHIHEFADDLYTRPVEPVNTGDMNAVSFTTGPRGQPTHWKQVAFLLRKPIELGVGERIEGRFMCRKGSDNSRELEVEIHYAVVKKGEKATEFTVQPYRVA